jgi:hypothetical protein
MIIAMCVAIILLPLWNGVGRVYGVGMYYYTYYYIFVMIPGEYSMIYAFAWIVRKIKDNEGVSSSSGAGSFSDHSKGAQAVELEESR